MHSLSLLSSFLAVLATFGSVYAVPHNTPRSKEYYARSHSLGEGYQFDSREWRSVNVSDPAVKYDKESPSRRDSKDTLSGSTAHLLNDVWNGLKGIGDPSTVKITWSVYATRSLETCSLTLARYTGHDLLNPSCWADGSWHPTV